MRILGSAVNRLSTYFFVYVLVGCSSVPVAHSSPQPISNNPWNCFSTDATQRPIARYSSLITCINDLTPSSAATFEERHNFNQALSTALSFVGREVDAITTFDSELKLGSTAPASVELSKLRRKPAVKFIVQQAKRAQILMINEAHHVPQTRGLTIRLLKPLFDQGYRYLAAESFSPVGIAEANQKKFPSQAGGFYTVEPVFGEMIREAKKIGFQLVAYEHEGQCDYDKDPSGCQDQREKGQAQNLIDRILKKDTSAKVIVHAGYGHISEIGSFDSFPWKPMARYFSELSGIDPLTIDQVTFIEHGKREIENPVYRDLLKTFQVLAPTVLTDQKVPWIYPSLRGQYDIQVVLPALNKNSMRPTWRTTFLGQKQITVQLPKTCGASDCFIETVRTSEENEQYVPSDLILVKDALSTNVMLSKGNYRVRVYDSKGQQLSASNVSVN